ncbi:MAG: ATP-binding protein [Spirochaetes bacterium]|nr:ATP-binding protein [Spirochaetota bacterium]
MKLIKPLLLLFLILILFTSCIYQYPNSLYFKNSLDLESWNFNRSDTIHLNKGWDIYSEQLLTPQDFIDNSATLIPTDNPQFKYGYITARQVVKLPADQSFILSFFHHRSAIKVWINGKLLLEDGKVARNKKEEHCSSANKKMVIFESKESNEIVIQLSNFHYMRGELGIITLGNSQKSFTSYVISIAWELFFQGAAFFFGLYHLVIFFYRRKEKSNLLFAIICFLFNLRMMTTGNEFLSILFQSIPFEIEWKIELISIYTATPLILTFLFFLFPEVKHKEYALFFYISSGIFIFITFFFPIRYQRILFDYYLFIIGTIFVYFIYIAIQIYHLNLVGSKIHIIAVSILVCFVILEILFYKFLHIGVTIGLLTQIGFFTFSLCNGFIIAIKYSTSSQKVERLSHDLKINNQKLIEADRLKDEFLANTSHELRTPLHGIIGIAQSLEDGIAGELPGEISSNIALISISAKRLYNLVNDILDFSKIRNNELAINKKAVDLFHTTEYVIQLNSPLVTHKDLEIINHIDPGLEKVLADENRIIQILNNLLSNAIKFTEHGKIEISAKPIEDMITIEVKDTGIGIDEEHYHRIFGTFNQIDGSIARKYGGTGLGLSITKKLVELQDGTIRVQSKLNEGSTFTFTLPRAKVSEITEDHTSQDISPNVFFEKWLFKDKEKEDEDTTLIETPYTLLLVDDDPINIHLLNQQLDDKRYQLINAYNGEVALKIVEENTNIDLIILDVMMPEVTGYDVCQIVREKYSIFELPILIVTAKNQIDNLIKGFELGANDYLIKPYHKLELRSRIETLLNLKKATESSEVLKNASDLKTQLLNIAAHNIRNPISSIMGYTSLLKKKPYLDHTDLRYIDIIIHSANRIVHLIDEILENTRIKDGKVVLNKINFNLDQMLKSIIEQNNQNAINKKQNIHYQSNENDLIISADHYRLAEVFDNLLSNAIKYSPQNKNIWINVNSENQEKLIVEIQDEGPGFSKDDLVKVFGEFQKLSAKPTGNENSTGLGLAITKRLVELHHGKIYVTNNRSGGATFTVELPQMNFT